MKRQAKSRGLLLVLSLVLSMLLGMTALASSDDNSLYDLGITTEGVTVEPEFAYNIWEYNVVVPAGTGTLELSPVPSSEQAKISDISGTTLDSEGKSTVLITVTSGSGVPFAYTLHVTSAAPAETEPVTEKQTEPVTEKQTEVQTEDSQYVKVDRNTIQEAESTITSLKGDITELRETVSLYTKIMYGLIGVSVVLLFIVINLMLKKKDLKAELNDYRSYGYAPERKNANRKPSNGQQKQNRVPEKRSTAKRDERAQETRKPEGRKQEGTNRPADDRRAQQPQRRAPQPENRAQEPERTAPVRKARTLPSYEEDNVVRQAAEQSKTEDALMREEQAAKRLEAAAAKAEARAQAQQAKAAAKQEEKQRREEAARAKEEQRQAKKRRGAAAEDDSVKIDMIDL